MVKTPAEWARYFSAYGFWNLELTHSGHNRRRFTTYSLSSGNEPGNPGLYDRVETRPRFDSFADLPHGIFRKGGDVEVFPDSLRRFRGGQKGCSALDRPRERDLGRSFANSARNAGDDRIGQQVRLAAVSQRG